VAGFGAVQGRHGQVSSRGHRSACPGDWCLGFETAPLARCLHSGRMEIGALAQVLLGVAVGAKPCACRHGHRRQYDRGGNGGCGNDRKS
jgi:hypothetical protein